jgi:hypothetical protein
VEETLLERAWREEVVAAERETGAWEEEGPAEAARGFFAAGARVGAGAAAAAAPSETLRYLRMVGVIGAVKLQNQKVRRGKEDKKKARTKQPDPAIPACRPPNTSSCPFVLLVPDPQLPS